MSECRVLAGTTHPQVVLGVLGCPNLPQEPIADADAGAEAAGHAADSDVGVIFAARRGGGAHVGPLKSGAPTGGPQGRAAWPRRLLNTRTAERSVANHSEKQSKQTSGFGLGRDVPQ